MIEINPSMYKAVDNNAKLGNFSIEWVEFNNEMFKGKETLLKYIAGEQQKKSSFIYLNKENFEIPLVALNPLVAETISKVGDPEGQVAEYFLVKQDGQLLICSPSFKSNEEEIIEGVDILKNEHQKLRRAYPEDALTMVDDLIEELRKRKVPQNTIDKIVMQFVKDCFKYAYMGMYDPHNTNWGILYSGIGDAIIAPMYDLDIGLNIPFKYKDEVSQEYRNYFDKYMSEIKSHNYIPEYISTLGRKYKWFDAWVKQFVNNVKQIDLEKQLLEQKGIQAHPKQIQHYNEFIASRNIAIENYLSRQTVREI